MGTFRLRRLPALLFGLAAAGLLAGCSPVPPATPPPQGEATRAPAVQTDAETGKSSVEVTVLTYNVAGLPWPAAADSGRRLRRIGDYLGELRREGREPDIVLIQEGFVGEMAALIERSGYPNFVHGPLATDRSEPLASPQARDYELAAYPVRGEGLGKWLHSGLYILSNFPIAEVRRRPFAHCAGIDCLANKGALLARVRIPGVPAPVDVLNTHLNAREAARVPFERSLRAHNLQVEELLRFLGEARDPRSPLLFGGDFNVRQSPERARPILDPGNGLTIVRYYCARIAPGCDARIPMASERPWLHTQDLLGFSEGHSAIRIRPTRLDALFSRPENGGSLSDHDGYLVRYRLAWEASAPARSKAAAQSSSRERTRSTRHGSKGSRSRIPLGSLSRS